MTTVLSRYLRLPEVDPLELDPQCRVCTPTSDPQILMLVGLDADDRIVRCSLPHNRWEARIMGVAPWPVHIQLVDDTTQRES